MHFARYSSLQTALLAFGTYKSKRRCKIQETNQQFTNTTRTYTSCSIRGIAVRLKSNNSTKIQKINFAFRGPSLHARRTTLRRIRSNRRGENLGGTLGIQQRKRMGFWTIRCMRASSGYAYVREIGTARF